MTFVILIDGRTTTERLQLPEAAERVAAGYLAGATVEARAGTRGRGYRPLTKKETEALATAAAVEIHG